MADVINSMYNRIKRYDTKDGGRMNSKAMKYVTNGTTVLFLAAMAVFVIYGMGAGLFTNKQELQLLIGTAGILAPLIFILLQITQVVFPLIPGGVTCLAGVFMFGPFWSFLYSYIGIIIGSFINFYLARRYGQNFVKRLVAADVYDKYMSKINSGRKFDLMFAAAIILPGFPDDVLCMLAGLTEMKTTKFALILLIGRPASLIFYSAVGLIS